MKNYEYTKSISSKEIDYLMSAALQGMGYWADGVHIVQHPDFPAPEDLDVSEALTQKRKWNIAIHDSQEDKWRVLSLKKLLRGLSLTDNLDLENYDMYDAERVVQRALFGKEVYA